MADLDGRPGWQTWMTHKRVLFKNGYFILRILNPDLPVMIEKEN
jgi:hypothetical protein